jgi:hypothetical protein
MRDVLGSLDDHESFGWGRPWGPAIKAQLLEEAAGVFGLRRSRNTAVPAVAVTSLHARMGEWKVTNKCWSGPLSQAGVRSAK